jgi:hypothetical protein
MYYKRKSESEKEKVVKHYPFISEQEDIKL